MINFEIFAAQSIVFAYYFLLNQAQHRFASIIIVLNRNKFATLEPKKKNKQIIVVQTESHAKQTKQNSSREV